MFKLRRHTLRQKLIQRQNELFQRRPVLCLDRRRQRVDGRLDLFAGAPHGLSCARDVRERRRSAEAEGVFLRRRESFAQPGGSGR